jgi:hypothetical protein
VQIERMKKLSEHQEMVLQISWCVHVYVCKCTHVKMGVGWGSSKVSGSLVGIKSQN